MSDSLIDLFSVSRTLMLTQDSMNVPDSLESLLAPSQSILKSKKHTRKMVDDANDKFMAKAMTQQRLQHQQIEIPDMDLRTQRLKDLALLRIQYYYLVDQVQMYSNALSLLLWAHSNLTRLLSKTCQSQNSLVPFIAPDPVMPAQEREISQVRQNIDDPTIWVGPRNMALQYMAEGSLGTDNTRRASGLSSKNSGFDFNFSRDRKRSLNKESDKLLASGWFRLGKFDLGTGNTDNQQQPMNLHEQIVLARRTLLQLKSSVSQMRAAICQLELRARKMSCQHICVAVNNVIMKHKNLLNI
jgi:hypothetical protein